MREICSHTGGVDNIIEGKVINKRGRLQQKGERLDDGLVEAHKRPDELCGGHTWPMPPAAPRTTNNKSVNDGTKQPNITYQL